MTVSMVTPELLNFVRGHLKTGSSKWEIAQTLHSQSWSDADIDDAFNKIIKESKLVRFWDLFALISIGLFVAPFVLAYLVCHYECGWGVSIFSLLWFPAILSSLVAYVGRRISIAHVRRKMQL